MEIHILDNARLISVVLLLAGAASAPTARAGAQATPAAAARDASPLSWVDAEAAPFLFIHGGLDDTIMAEPSRRMAAAPFDAEVETVYAVMPDVGHDGSNYWFRNGPLILGFLEMLLHPAA